MAEATRRPRPDVGFARASVSSYSEAPCYPPVTFPEMKGTRLEGAPTDADGALLKEPARRQLCVIDGIICGEGEGPLDPAPRPAGVIIASDNPVSADFVAADVAG